MAERKSVNKTKFLIQQQYKLMGYTAQELAFYLHLSGSAFYKRLDEGKLTLSQMSILDKYLHFPAEIKAQLF